MTRQSQGLVGQAREQLVKRFLLRRNQQEAESGGLLPQNPALAHVPDKFCSFEKFAEYERIKLSRFGARKLGVENPFFKVHDGVANATTQIDGKTYINFSS